MGTLKSLAFLALFISLSLSVFADTSNDAKGEVKPSEATNNDQALAQAETETEAVEAVEPQQGWGGGSGCRWGCCGPWRYGGCTYCCRRPQAEAEVVEPQQSFGGGRCRWGCCGPWHHGHCSYCCRRPQAEAEVVEPKAKP